MAYPEIDNRMSASVIALCGCRAACTPAEDDRGSRGIRASSKSSAAAAIAKTTY